MKDFYLGAEHFFAATSFLRKHKLLHYYLYPVILLIIYFVLLTSAVLRYSAWLVRWIFGDRIPEKLPEFDGLFSFLNALGSFSVTGLVSFLAGLLIFLLSAKLSKYILLIMLSPVFAFLSERVDEIITGNRYPFNPVQFLKDIIRGTLIALRNLFLELLLIGLFSLAGLFGGPLAFLVSPVLWLIGAYYYGFSMLDYTCERRKMSIREGIRYIRNRKSFTLGIGVLYALLDLIPLFGWIVAPVNAVTGATSGLIALEKNENRSVTV